MMARISVGTVTPVPKGEYSATATYNRLNWVKYNGALYCCKANGVVGVSPENTEFWMKQLDAPTDADGVSYDNSASGLESTKVQGAIDEVVADLGESSTALNSNLELAKAELQVLGWNVPKEMSVKNTLENGVLTQKVGRVDGGLLNWIYRSELNCFIVDAAYFGMRNLGWLSPIPLFCSKYTTPNSYKEAIDDKEINGVPWSYISEINIRDDVFNGNTEEFKSSMRGQYLYYELATPITHTVSDTSSVQEMISDEWKSGSSSTYKAGEYKIYNNVLKKCLIDCNGSVSFDNDTYWVRVNLAKEIETMPHNFSVNRNAYAYIKDIRMQYPSDAIGDCVYFRSGDGQTYYVRATRV